VAHKFLQQLIAAHLADVSLGRAAAFRPGESKATELMVHELAYGWGHWRCPGPSSRRSDSRRAAPRYSPRCGPQRRPCGWRGRQCCGARRPNPSLGTLPGASGVPRGPAPSSDPIHDTLPDLKCYPCLVVVLLCIGGLCPALPFITSRKPQTRECIIWFIYPSLRLGPPLASLGCVIDDVFCKAHLSLLCLCVGFNTFQKHPIIM
jgi:hypothetical protein